MSAARTTGYLPGDTIDDPSAFDAGDFARVDVMGFLRANLKLIAAVTLTIFAMGLTYALLMPPRYRSSAQLLIDPRGLQILKNEITKSGETTDGNLIDIENQRYVLLSRSVLKPVVEREKLAEHPLFGGGPPGLFRQIMSGLGFGRAAPSGAAEARAIQVLSEAVDVVRGERAYVLEVVVTTRDPDLSARLANLIAQIYVEIQNDARWQAARRASDALSKRANDLRREVQEAEEKVERFRAENKLTLGATGRLIGESQVGDLSTQLGQVRGRVAEAQARLTAVERVRKSGLNLDATTEAIQSPTIVALRAQLAQQTQQEAALASQLGPRHPALIQAQEQTRELRRQIMAELERIEGSARTDLQRAKATEAALDKRVGDVRSANDNSSVAMVQLRDLERAAEAGRAVYQAFLSRAKELDESQGIDTTNTRVISPAIPALKTSGPPAWLILVGAALFGLSAGVGAAYLRERLLSGATPQRVSERTGLPTLAIFETRAPAAGFRALWRGRAPEGQLMADRAGLAALVARLRIGRSGGARAVAFVGIADDPLQAQFAAAFAEYVRWEGLDVALVDAANPARPALVAAFADDLRENGAGRVEVMEADALGGARDAERRLRRLVETNDLAIFDCPDGGGAAAPVFAEAADRIVFVAPTAHLRGADLIDAMARLADEQDKFAGLVFIGAPATGRPPTMRDAHGPAHANRATSPRAAPA